MSVTSKVVGRIYQQTFVDTYRKVAFAKLYTTKTLVTVADVLNDKVLPYFEEHELSMLRILADRRTEYCGRVDHHDYQLYLAINDIDHTKTKAMSPQTIGICERFHKTISNEFYLITYRKKLYANMEELQKTWTNGWNTITMSELIKARYAVDELHWKFCWRVNQFGQKKI